MVKVAVIFPSRGLMFSRTAEELLVNLKGYDHKMYFSHRRPIPDCFELPTNEALKDPDVTHLFFVEDDMTLRPSTLKKLLAADANAVTIDYPITKDGVGSVFRDESGQVIFSGTGCLLVKRKVFDSLKKPYFTDKISWVMYNDGDSVRFVGVEGPTGYGKHDVTFGFKLFKQGVTIQCIAGKLGQRKLVELGKSGSNNGAHKIEEWKRLRKNALLTSIKAQPLSLPSKSKLVTIDTPSGGVNTTPEHAENLVKQGLATYPPHRYTVIDDSEVQI